ncbi:MAG: glycoside hydrolase family 16 protein [Planctomycetota bacterium]
MRRTPLLAAALLVLAAACSSSKDAASPVVDSPREVVVDVPLHDELSASAIRRKTMLGALQYLPEDGDAGWVNIAVDIPVTGRYRTEIVGVGGTGTLWVEDYVENGDGRTYDVTGPIEVDVPLPAGERTPGLETVGRDGSPLREGRHRMRVHFTGPSFLMGSVRFTLLREHRDTPETLTQAMDGDGEWALVWADEFDGEGVPDPAKWTHDLGNWGWGNREPQYYTSSDPDNARQEDGFLIIEARPDDDGHAWTSARLTTRAKVSFLRGRFVIRAKVPAADGVWAAGWTLGDEYRDEISWPYCGEIDVMEAVGREIDDATGDGVNHASCHTRAYYFKQGNHISNTIEVAGMSKEFHDYVCEWDEDEVRMYVDDTHYYTYDKKESEFAWPFDRPQNLILNLAMGGGMGGDIAPGIGPQRVIVDHVRVYERR